MAKGRIQLIGWEKVQRDFIAWSNSPKPALQSFMQTVEASTLKLLYDNTPVDTGELRASWTVLEKTPTSLVIGVTDDQEEKLFWVVNGNQYQPANNFMKLVDSSVNNLISTGLTQELVRRHRFWKPIQGKVNITSTVGLTGTTYNKRRSRGRSSIVRPRTGRLSTRVRIGRRRSTKGLGNDFFKDIKIGKK